MSNASNRAMLAMILGLGAGAGVMPTGADRIPLPIVQPQLRVSKRQLLRASSYGVITWGYLKRPPSTNARERRAAVKAKNRAKHRRACRS